ncbi:MAG TPA: KOW motif-containing protein [Chloroflexota bacterium]
MTSDIQSGDKVKLTGGGYKGSEGTVEETDGELLKVKVNSFGMPMTVRVERTQVEKLNG